MHSNARTIASGKNIDKVKELVEKFGGKASDWKKMKTWDEAGNEIHYYVNNGKRVGTKLAGQPDPF